MLDVLSNPPLEGADYRHLTRPQTAILKHPITGKIEVDVIIRFENLQSDLDEICERIGTSRILLPHVNASPREKDYRHYFDAETRGLTEHMFADDIETFGFEF